MQSEKDTKKIKKNAMNDVISVIEELASAMVMALLIIGFVVQPFIIPTGSMAETLNGAHFRLCCPQCGFKYDTNFTSTEYGLRENTVPRGLVVPPVTRCPSCGYYDSSGKPVAVSKGDKILALKCIYQFFEPKRWDVVVFKNPLNPMENYIKRLIAKPGETVEIIDGDIYIDGQIARKPPKVQEELWMPVYNNNYLPVKPYEPKFNSHTWKMPLKNYGSSVWKVSADRLGEFCLDDMSGIENRLIYDTSIGNDFHATYAYNKVQERSHQPICSDLKVSFDFTAQANDFHFIGAGLRKNQRHYKALFDKSGYMSIVKVENGIHQELAGLRLNQLIDDSKIHFSFANVDHLLIFSYGSQELRYDLGLFPTDAGAKKYEIEPEVEIIGSGKLSICEIAIYRDIYYTSVNPQTGRTEGNAVEGSPFILDSNEFFVLGDNSPGSYDSRWWAQSGIGNNAQKYRIGTVPRDYLVGKAVFVFWPSGFRPFNKFPIACVPNVGKIRLIYGGSDGSLKALLQSESGS